MTNRAKDIAYLLRTWNEVAGPFSVPMLDRMSGDLDTFADNEAARARNKLRTEIRDLLTEEPA